jgi:hypothetical protein
MCKPSGISHLMISSITSPVLGELLLKETLKTGGLGSFCADTI